MDVQAFVNEALIEARRRFTNSDGFGLEDALLLSTSIRPEFQQALEFAQRLQRCPHHWAGEQIALIYDFARASVTCWPMGRLHQGHLVLLPLYRLP